MKKLLLLLLAGAFGLSGAARPVKGRVQCEGQPVCGVLITDGFTFAQTDQHGAYLLNTDERAHFLYMVTPADYIAPAEEGFPCFYKPLNKKTQQADFELQRWDTSRNGYELLAIADPQPKTAGHFERLSSEIIPILKTAADTARIPQAALLLGDIVWDAPELMHSVKSLFGTLGIPVYPLIGNHDHDRTVFDDDASAANYRAVFGPTYYAFDLGDTHYIVLDDIIYHGAKQYDEQIDSLQLAWTKRYAEYLPQGSRVCIAMHAPLMKSWLNRHMMESAAELLAAFSGFDLHFITGHTHINSNFDIAEGVVEHNVAQLCGNLWHDPLNQDGTPKGYQVFSEKGDCFAWRYQSLGKTPDKQIRLWRPGEVKTLPGYAVAKIWNWDSHWTVVWYEDGRYKGAMQPVSMADPDYIAHLDSLLLAGRKLAKAQKARPLNFYFTARPSDSAHTVEVVATDRFGNRYSETIFLQ